MTSKVTLLCVVFALMTVGAQSTLSLRRNLNSDPYCNTWNYTTDRCDKCAWRTVKIDNVCTPVSDDCSTWDEATG